MPIQSTLFLAAALFTAQAQDTDEEAVWNANPIYIQARGGLAVPAGSNGDVPTAGVGIGIVSSDQNSFGMRFIYMADPPENPLGQKAPNLPYAWGPVVDWTYLATPNQRASLFTTVSVGYVYGVPEEKNHNNIILPIIEGGMGIRFSRKAEDGKVFYTAPEIGFVPGAIAPMCALSVGIILPGSKNRTSAQQDRSGMTQ